MKGFAAAITLSALLPLTLSCAGSPDELRAGSAEGSDTRNSPVPLPERSPRHEIRWDFPIEGGLDTSFDEAASRGELTFRPRKPRFAREAKRVQVTNPKTTGPSLRALAAVYDFAGESDIPGDGRVLLQQAPADITVRELDEMAASTYPGMTFTRFSEQGAEAILLSANGIGRVIMLREGLKLDLTGPAIPPSAVRRLAAQL